MLGRLRDWIRFEARKAVVQRLDEEGFLVRVEDYHHTVPYSERGQGAGGTPALDPVVRLRLRFTPGPADPKPWILPLDKPQFLPVSVHCRPNVGGRTKVYRDWVGELEGLVYLSAALVGAPDSGLVMPSAKPAAKLLTKTPFIVAATIERCPWNQSAVF